MIRLQFNWIIRSAAVFILLSVSLFSQSQEILKARREKVMSQMKPNSVMVIRSQGSHRTFHREAQEATFFYLTGIDEAGAFLVLSKSAETGGGSTTGPGTQTIMFSVPVNRIRAAWDAQPLGIQGIRKLGFKDVRSSATFADYFDSLLLSNIDVLYMNPEKSVTVSSPLTADEQIVQRSREKGSTFTLLSSDEIFTPMGRTRDPSEISFIQKAIDITAKAHLAAMHVIQPGMQEYQVQAMVDSVCFMNGSRRVAFPTIVGSGINSCILHWMRNSKTMQAGELVVLDMGATWYDYPADITRTYPVNGKFSIRQREVYEIVLAANQAAIAMVAPGVEYQDISRKAADIIGMGLVKLGKIKDKSEYRKYYFHGLSHHLGARIGGRTELGKLEPGMVFTIEPGIYIREEKIGVRIEDDVLVTETGHKVLTSHVPKTIAEIERQMKKKGPDYSDYLLREKGR